MKFVLDTNVVSALRVQGRNRAVEAWAAGVAISDLFVTAMTVTEIERGVVATERSDEALIAAIAQSAEMTVDRVLRRPPRAEGASGWLRSRIEVRL